MRMISGSRRVLLYWVLMLLPTLAVGGGVLWLLSREQARLEMQTQAAVEARKTAVAARARLIAENVELLVGDVQIGLMQTLREAPTGAELRAFLAQWKANNPLVAETFELDAMDRNSAAGVAGRSGAGVEGWLRRLVEQGAPWDVLTGAKKVTPLSQTDEVLPQQNLMQMASNSGQTFNTRNELQSVANIGSKTVWREDRAGWLPWRDGGKLRLVGWREIGDGRVIGVEVKLAAVAARLGDVLPEGRETGEAYELREREIGGARFQQKAERESDASLKVSSMASSLGSGTRTPSITVPVSEQVLPGWEVVGFLDVGLMRTSSGVFFTLTAVLAGILVAAILAGGTLLLRQARRSEEEALQKTSFVANVSHELKTPLTTIRLYAELLEQNRVPDPEKRTEYLRTIGRETQRLTRLVNNVLGFSRLDQGKKRFDLVEIDVSAEVIRLLDAQKPALAASGLVLRTELPTEGGAGGTGGVAGMVRPLRVKIDLDAFEQILLNLLDNACKYAFAGGEVFVKLSVGANKGTRQKNSGADGNSGALGSGMRLVVADRGPGVPASQRERIFEKFHRIDETLTAEKGGAGLGLSIARQLARGLGGELRCADRNGGGAEFIFELP